MENPPRISRLLEIVTLLQSGTGWTAPALAERFGVSRTRIFQDVRALRDAGVPVRRSKLGYRMDPGFFLPSVRLTPQEALALLFPSELYQGAEPNGEVRRSAQEKLLSCLPDTMRARAEELLRRTDVALPTSSPDGEVLAQIRSAMAERQRLAIVYSGRTSDRPRRLEVDPYGLAFRKHAWYLLAYSVAHREIRKFRLSRIGAVELTPLHFTVPQDFAVEAYFDGAWYVFGGEPREIAVRFSPRVARFVRERVPHPGQIVQTLSDGTILYRATVRSLDEVAWWLVQYGGEAVVIYPSMLRDKVVALATGILDAYAPSARKRRLAYPLPPDVAADTVAEPGADSPPAARS